MKRLEETVKRDLAHKIMHDGAAMIGRTAALIEDPTDRQEVIMHVTAILVGALTAYHRVLDPSVEREELIRRVVDMVLQRDFDRVVEEVDRAVQDIRGLKPTRAGW